MEEKVTEKDIPLENEESSKLYKANPEPVTDNRQPFQLKVETLGVIASILISLFSLFIAGASILWDITEFSVSNQSKLLGQCAVENNASTTIGTRRSSPVLNDETGKYYADREPAEIIVEAKCLLFNDGLKSLSILNAQSILVKDGKEGSRRIQPLVLIEPDVVNTDVLPIKIEPGESKIVSVYAKIHISLETRGEEYVTKAFAVCTASSTDGYSSLSQCLSREGFSISKYVYEEPFPSANTQGGGTYNGIGIQFITDSNIASTFEVVSLGFSLKRNNSWDTSPYYLHEGEVKDHTSRWP